MENRTPVTERTVSSLKARYWLMGLVGFFFVCSIITLLWIGRDGGIKAELKIQGFGKLAAFYLPIVLLMLAFYFGRKRSRRRNATVPLENFVFTLIVIIAWVLTPVFLLVFIPAIEDTLATLEKIKPYGDSVALVAIGYYFSKD